MGISSLSISLLIAAVPVPVASQPVASEVPMAAEEYQQVLWEGDVVKLGDACSDAARFGLDGRLKELRDRLLQVAPSPQPLAVVMANTQALLACKAPDSARRVLSRYSPGPGPRRQQWLLLSWRTAAAARDHEAAILALRRLAEGDLARLEALQLEFSAHAGGVPATRSALDQLADHEAALGRIDRAAAVALSGRSSGVIGARRLAQAARWLESLGQNDATTILETALDQAAMAQAWSLAEELLNIQLRMERKAGGDGARPRQRLERLASRVDDRYTLWQLLQNDPQSPETEARRLVLEQQLRSPRQVGASTLEESKQEGPDGSDSPATP
jgi:hypothetical protein